MSIYSVKHQMDRDDQVIPCFSKFVASPTVNDTLASIGQQTFCDRIVKAKVPGAIVYVLIQ